jgi:hypothetical protein
MDNLRKKKYKVKKENLIKLQIYLNKIKENGCKIRNKE